MACTVTMKGFTWFVWAVNALISGLWSGVALTTFSKIQTATDKLTDDSKAQAKSIRDGMLAACMLGFLMVLFFVVYSLLVLVSRFFGDVKLMYGIMLGTAFHTAWFMLLAGLVLQAGNDFVVALKDDVVPPLYSSTDYTTYQATYVIAYILVAMYLVVYCIFYFGRKALGRSELQGAGASTNGAPVNVYMDMGSMKNTGSMQRTNQV